MLLDQDEPDSKLRYYQRSWLAARGSREKSHVTIIGRTLAILESVAIRGKKFQPASDARAVPAWRRISNQ